jgi:hypothetical protein
VLPETELVQFDALTDWTRRTLGSSAVAETFRISHLSTVVGLRLADGRDVVVKIRPRQARVAGCLAVHAAMWRAGFPCAEPLTEGLELGSDLVISAEMMVADGTAGGFAPSSGDSARALQRLIAMSPSPDAVPALTPPPPWVWWGYAGNGIWPFPDDRDVDLNEFPGPSWLDDAATRVRTRLARYRADPVIGHADWEAQNVLWAGSRLHVVHDWDSAVALPEATIAGAAAAVHATPNGRNGSASIAHTSEFIDAYASAAMTVWTDDDREAAWAAGLWVLVFNAKKAIFDPSDSDRIERLESELSQRLERAAA